MASRDDGARPKGSLQRPFPFVPDIKDAGVADKLENYLRVHMSKISELDVGFCLFVASLARCDESVGARQPRALRGRACAARSRACRAENK